MLKTIIAATVVAAASFATSASAATLSGTFSVEYINITNLDRDESKATLENAQAAFAGTLGGGTSANNQGSGEYTGSIDFGTYLSGGPNHDATTIGDWLESAPGGSFTPNDNPENLGLQLSKDSIGNGTATTTFFLFIMKDTLGAADFTVRHDDGVLLFDDNDELGGFAGPNGVRTTQVDGFDGGVFSFLYVATNGDPSVLEIDIQPVPLPATLPLLLAGFGGLAIMRRKRAA